MPLTKKGKKVMDAMIKKYGKKKGTKVFMLPVIRVA